MKKRLSIVDFNVQIKECKDKKKRQKMRAVYLYEIRKKPAKEVALKVHTSFHNVYQWAFRYRKYGAESFESKPRGGRRKALMSFDDEKKILETITEDSGKGLIVVAKQVLKKAAAQVDKKIGKSYAYAFMHRHGWRKVKPRPKNPKSSKEAQEQFKKDFSKSVEEIAKTFDSTDKRPLMTLFEDEARFGRMTRPVHCWAPEKVRPIVPCQLVRQFLYVYSVVCPKTGKNFSLIMSDADTEMMNIFLTEVSNHYKDFLLIIVVDQASWHKSKGLKKFDNIRFLLLPPGSPELNPAEHIWEHVREKYFANRSFDSIGSVKDLLIKVFKEIHLNPDSIQSLVHFSWAN